MQCAACKHEHDNFENKDNEKFIHIEGVVFRINDFNYRYDKHRYDKHRYDKREVFLYACPICHTVQMSKYW